MGVSQVSGPSSYCVPWSYTAPGATCPRPVSGQVAVVFEVPLTFLVNRANHIVEESEWHGNMWRYYSIPYGERYIWGVTAGMIRNLSERLDPPC